MAGAIVQSQYAVVDSGANSTTIAVTLSSVVSGNLIAVHVGWEDVSGSITCSVSDGSSYSVAAAKVRDTGNQQSGGVFYLANVGSGSHSITATFSSTTAFRRIRAVEISGEATTTPLDQGTGQFQSSPGTGSNGVSSGASSATTNANDFVLGFSQDTAETDPGTGTVTAGTGYTISGSNIILSLESKTVSATGAQTATFTQSANHARVTHVVAFKDAAGGGVSAALTGSATTSAAGTLAPATDKALSGQAITSAAGTLSVTNSEALTGQGITSAAGTVGVDIQVPLTGQSATFATGTVSTGSDVTAALTGQAATFSAGTVTPASNIALTGSSIASAQGAVTPSLNLALTGVSGTFAPGTLLSDLSVLVSGQSATFTPGTLGIVGDVTVALTGVSASFTPGNLSIAAEVTAEAGRRTRFRNIYRITIDGRQFQCSTLAEALELLEKAKALAKQVAQSAVREATRAVKTPISPPKIEVNTRELRAAVTETKREIAEIYRQALIDSEIAMLFELEARQSYNDDALLILM